MARALVRERELVPRVACTVRAHDFARPAPSRPRTRAAAAHAWC